MITQVYAPELYVFSLLRGNKRRWRIILRSIRYHSICMKYVLTMSDSPSIQSSLNRWSSSGSKMIKASLRATAVFRVSPIDVFRHRIVVLLPRCSIQSLISGVILVIIWFFQVRLRTACEGWILRDIARCWRECDKQNCVIEKKNRFEKYGDVLTRLTYGKKPRNQEVKKLKLLDDVVFEFLISYLHNHK